MKSAPCGESLESGKQKLPHMGKTWFASPAERNKLVGLARFDYGPTWAQMLVDNRLVCRPASCKATGKHGAEKGIWAVKFVALCRPRLAN